MKCSNCGGTDVVTNDARGERACSHCGTVLEEGVMVESVSFSESSGVVGQYVSFATGGSGGGRYGSSTASREQVLQRGRGNIQRVADQLRLPVPHQESAHRIFVLAVQRNFTIGRHGTHVAAACLYVICRRQKTPHMLIDFSDVLRVPVRTLGRVFVKLVRLLHIPVPEIDPSLFMERYASQMELSDQTQAVAATGVRLIQAMTRDWIATGRRPTGLCGAALLIAARYHGFKINAVDMVPIVRISWYTLHRRLNEFGKTSTAALTSDEFATTDLTTLPVLNGPPAFDAARRKEARQRLKALGGGGRRARRLATKQAEALEQLSSDEDVDDGEEEAAEESRKREILDGGSGESSASGGGSGGLGLDFASIDFDGVWNRSGSATDEGTPLDSTVSGSGKASSSAGEGDEVVAASETTENMRSLNPAVCGSHSLESLDKNLLYSENPSSSDIEAIAGAMMHSLEAGGRERRKGLDGPSESVNSRVARTETDGERTTDSRAAVATASDADHCPPPGERPEVTQGAVSEKAAATGEIGPSTLQEIDPDLFESSPKERSPSGSCGEDGNGAEEVEDPLAALLRDVVERSSDLLPETSGTVRRGEPTTEDGDPEGQELAVAESCSIEHGDGESCALVAQEEAVMGKLVGVGEETLSDVSDSEIDGMLLSESEKATKTLIWDEMTKDVMPEVHRRLRERKRKIRESGGEYGGPRKRRKKDEDLPAADTAADSVRMAFQKKASSAAKRLNDQVLDALFA